MEGIYHDSQESTHIYHPEEDILKGFYEDGDEHDDEFGFSFASLFYEDL